MICPAVSHAAFQFGEKRKYSKWVKKYGTLSEADRESLKSAVEVLAYRPLISIVLPVYNVEERWLRLCIESVLNQIYSRWQLCIADDCSPSKHVQSVLDEYARSDQRIRIVYGQVNGHISAASNSALELAEGDFTVLLDHDDELTEDALYWIADELNNCPGADLIYSDEDKIDEQGRRSEPKFKPDWSRDLFYSLNLVTHLSCFRTDILRKIGGFREGFEGSQDYDLVLRFTEQIPDSRIRHIPRVLYHWRAIGGSVALSGDEKPYAHERARAALREHFERTNIDARVEPAFQNMHRVRYALPDGLPRVSVFVLGGTDASSHLARSTEYEHCEFISVGVAASELNFAAAGSVGEVLCFVRGDLMPENADWLRELVSHAIQPDIGAVGGKVLNKDRTIEYAGMVLRSESGTVSAHHGYPCDAAGNLSRLQLTGNFSAVSVSCMAVSRDKFDGANGFDGENLEKSLFDADLCLKLMAAGLRNVFTPYVSMISTDKNSWTQTTSSAELQRFKEKWGALIMRDPFYNPNLLATDGRFSIKI